MMMMMMMKRLLLCQVMRLEQCSSLGLPLSESGVISNDRGSVAGARRSSAQRC
jgi:hypothetical protein